MRMNIILPQPLFIMTLKNICDMKPDKIYFGFCEATHLESYCLEKKGECQTEYIRKDALLEWLEYTKKLWSQTGSSLAAMQTVQMVIDKINSL